MSFATSKLELHVQARACGRHNSGESSPAHEPTQQGWFGSTDIVLMTGGVSKRYFTLCRALIDGLGRGLGI